VRQLSRQCGILDISQPYRTSRPVTGTDLFIFFSFSNVALYKTHFADRWKNLLGRANVAQCIHTPNILWLTVKIKLVAYIECLLDVFTVLVCVSLLWAWKEHSDVG
jgi:hypothetical protein